MKILKCVAFGNSKNDDIYRIVVLTHIKEETITAVSPLFTSRGSFFKNITVLEDSFGNTHKIIGKVNDYIYLVNKPIKNKIGYK